MFSSKTAKLQLGGFALALMLLAPEANAGGGHKHGDDFIIGVTGSGQLAFESEPIEEGEILHLEQVMGIINGWAGEAPGFMPLDEDEPAEDFFKMAIGATIHLEIVATDQAFKFHSPGFGEVFDSPGDRWEIATVVADPPAFDTHPEWHIDSDDPTLLDNQTIWHLTCKFVDTGSTGYTDSDPFVIRFSNAEVEDILKRDVNLDGNVTRADVCAWGSVVQDPASATPDEKFAADANQDGFVDTLDSFEFMRPFIRQFCLP